MTSPEAVGTRGMDKAFRALSNWRETRREDIREEQIKVTIGLSKASVNFFKEPARRHHTQYQKMIRRLLDLYVAQHQ